MPGEIQVATGTGPNVYVETPSGAPDMPASKIHTGALDVDGGPVTPTNPFPVAIEVSGAAVDPRAVRALTSADVVTSIPSDGTHAVTVKPASTAAVGTDTALVVAISPNNSITATNPSVGATAAAVPADATMIGGPDGSGNLRAPVVKATDGASADEGMVVRPVQGTAANLAATATQGPAAALGSAWPVKVTDGTNTQPTGDAVARSIAVQVNDGTNVLGTSAHPVQVNVTNGTQSLPTGDAVARSINVQVNDGTNVLGTTAHPVRVADAGTDATNNVEAIANLPMAGTTYAPSFSSNLASAGAAVKASAGNLRSLCATNRNASLRWLQVFNQTTAPASSNVPIFQVPLPPGGSTTPTSVIIGEDFFSNQGINLSTGISVGVSTASGSYTAATSADHDIFATYK